MLPVFGFIVRQKLSRNKPCSSSKVKGTNITTYLGVNEDDDEWGERHIVPTQTATVGDRENFMAEVIGQKRYRGESPLLGWR